MSFVSVAKKKDEVTKLGQENSADGKTTGREAGMMFHHDQSLCLEIGLTNVEAEGFKAMTRNPSLRQKKGERVLHCGTKLLKTKRDSFIQGKEKDGASSETDWG